MIFTHLKLCLAIATQLQVGKIKLFNLALLRLIIRDKYMYYLTHRKSPSFATRRELRQQ